MVRPGDRGERDLTTVITSPCVGVCQLRPGTSLCEGCLRTASEIGEWSAASDERRALILQAAIGRREAEHTSPSSDIPSKGGHS